MRNTTLHHITIEEVRVGDYIADFHPINRQNWVRVERTTAAENGYVALYTSRWCISEPSGREISVRREMLS
jgi:hypothetical protein